MKSPGRKSLDVRLYLVLDPTIIRFRSVEGVLEEAIRGGVTLVQVREKQCSNDEFLQLARRASTVLGRLGVPLIVNDRVDVALAIGAQGVHVGQADLPWSEARRLLGPDAIVGLSVESTQQALLVEGADLDYLGVSSVFPTPTKKDTKHIWGIRGLKALRRVSSHLLVAIGGIDATNAREVVEAGADGIAVVSAICSGLAPCQEARALRAIVDSAGRSRSGFSDRLLCETKGE